MDKSSLAVVLALIVVLLQAEAFSSPQKTDPRTATKQREDQREETLLSSANSLSAHGKYAEAAALYRRLVTASKPKPRAFHMYGRTLALMRKFEEAAVQYRKALALAPGNVEIMNDLAVVLTRSGDPLEAKKLLTQATRISPMYVTGYNNLGSVLIKLGDYGQAVHVLNHSLSLQPGNSNVRKMLNQALGKLFDQDGKGYEDWSGVGGDDLLSRSTSQEDPFYLDVDLLAGRGSAGLGISAK